MIVGVINMFTYQILKNGDGKYIVGQLIPYFWSWTSKHFDTYNEAYDELQSHLGYLKANKAKRKTEVVYEISMDD